MERTWEVTIRYNANATRSSFIYVKRGEEGKCQYHFYAQPCTHTEYLLCDAWFDLISTFHADQNFWWAYALHMHRLSEYIESLALWRFFACLDAYLNTQKKETVCCKPRSIVHQATWAAHTRHQPTPSLHFLRIIQCNKERGAQFPATLPARLRSMSFKLYKKKGSD